MYPGRCGHYAAVQEVYQVLVAAEIGLKHITDINVQYYLNCTIKKPRQTLYILTVFLKPILPFLITHKAILKCNLV